MLGERGQRYCFCCLGREGKGTVSVAWGERAKVLCLLLGERGQRYCVRCLVREGKGTVSVAW